MLICLDLHALCYMPCFPMPCFPMLCSSFCSRMMLGYMLTCLYDVIGYTIAWIYVSMCLFLCYMVRSLSSHACMLGSMFLHVYVLGFYMFTFMFLCLMSRSMLSHAYVLGSMSSTCFMLSSMCLCTPCHVCVPRPRPCLSCHVLL